VAPWSIEGTDEFADWYGSLDAADQRRVDYYVGLLEERGPLLGRPYADTVNGSRYKNMKELRVQAHGDPIRIFFLFDPRQVGVLLIGGNKTGDARFYDTTMRIAEELYTMHLLLLEQERDD
jgi:hypothetical protein